MSSVLAVWLTALAIMASILTASTDITKKQDKRRPHITGFCSRPCVCYARLTEFSAMIARLLPALLYKRH